MPLTFREFKQLIFPYAGRSGKAVTSPDVSKFATEVMQALLHAGSTSAIRSLTIVALKGKLVLPPEVEIPLKVRINGHRSLVWNQWYTLGAADTSLEDGHDAFSVLAETGNETPLAYEIPAPGMILGVTSTCDEDEDTTIILQTKDQSGREVYSSWRGERVTGEKLTIEKGKINYGNVLSTQVTGVVKARTNGYVILYGIDPATRDKTFLAAWSPSEERPMYRQFVLAGMNDSPVVELRMLVRARLKDNYNDNELTLFDNARAIKLAAQQVQAESNNDINTAAYKTKALTDALNNEGSYKDTAPQPIQVYRPLSGGSIKNIV